MQKIKDSQTYEFSNVALVIFVESLHAFFQLKEEH